MWKSNHLFARLTSESFRCDFTNKKSRIRQSSLMVEWEPSFENTRPHFSTWFRIGKGKIQVARRERFIRQKYVDLYFYRKRAHYQHISEINKMISNARKPKSAGSSKSSPMKPFRKKIILLRYDEKSVESDKDAAGCSTTVGNTTMTPTNTSRTRTITDRDDSNKSDSYKRRDKKRSKKRASSKKCKASKNRKKTQKKNSPKT